MPSNGAAAARKAKMDEACARIRASLKELEQAAAAPTPDPKQVVQSAQTIQSALQQWQQHHQAIGQELGAN